MCPLQLYSATTFSHLPRPVTRLAPPTHCQNFGIVHSPLTRPRPLEIRTQNTVPSLTMSIGGPPDSGRFSFAISRPPFQVALSSTCARVSCSFDRLSLARIWSAIRSLVGRTKKGRQREIQRALVTHSSITVIARHSTMAGCEGRRRGILEETEG
jgi:hypothetical protein